MPENVQAWWARRQRSKNTDTPYPVGRYRTDWERYPVLVRQFHPDLNHGITLTQIPPAADVYLHWQCDAGHHFVATPGEQRQRPDGSRRRSTWCPECAAGAVRRRSTPAPRDATVPRRPQPLACGHPVAMARRPRGGGAPTCRVCTNARGGTATLKPGTAFVSPSAPVPASRAEADLRERLRARLAVDLAPNAVRVAQPFFAHLEVWPDFVIGELAVAIEYDTTGRDGLEHVGQREDIDKRKDRLLRQVGWEVIRIRCGKLQPIGPWDITASGVSGALVDRVVDRLGDVRGHLFVSAYLN
ncbi:zinc-ribbon domain-containing protein [Marisediminicola senii]|uniref:zinc-ribbon domain-containing protein n=1 Tax=Marisediminicola senii TaxID=2711233 RepID=UPI0013EE3BFB|nr:zinc-ribbon domain-containing protein [Marisediminicola senii]